MGDTRDPEADQSAPKPGGAPVQAVLIEALRQRMEFGFKKYGTLLETHNGRDPLRDMWEEMLDMVSYFTQFILEQGVELPGLEKFANKSTSMSTEAPKSPRGPRADLVIYDEISLTPGARSGTIATSGEQVTLIPMACGICLHEPHTPGRCRSDAPGGLINCQCGFLVNTLCSHCRHDPHEPGRCRSQALNLGCGCTGEPRFR